MKNITYYPLVNKMMTVFRLKEKSAGEESVVQGFTRPFITVARDPGSGGAPIAEMLAKKLGYEFIDEQIIDKIAKSIKKRKAVIKAVDEKSRGRIEDIVHSILNTEYVDDATYVTELVKVILAYAHQGHVVILGRGANFICPFQKGLHINITAPYDIRVGRAMDYEGFDKKKAKEVIAKVEKERRDFVKQYFRKDVRDMDAYNLTLNTAYYRIDEAVDIILQAFERKFPKFGF